jgi:phosphomannomutase
MKETGAPLAGEMSGHIFFKHRWYGFDDALYASVRLIEAVAASGKSLTELRDSMPESLATPRASLLHRRSPASFAVIEEVRDQPSADGATVDATDGVRVKTQTGWWLLRASNTQDVLVARAEAKDALAREARSQHRPAAGTERSRAGRGRPLGPLVASPPQVPGKAD